MQNEAFPVRIEGPVKVDAEVKAIMVGDNGKSAYEIALAHGFVGTEEEWLESLKAKMPNLSGVVSALQGKNVLINSSTLEAILSAIVHALAEQPYAPLTFREPRKGDTELRVSGQDGFKVRVSGSTEAVEIQSGSATIRIQPYGADDIYLEYLNLIDHVVDTDHNIINLPKATDIDRDAFANSSLAVINIPAFVWADDNLDLKSYDLIRVNKMTVSEESHPPRNVMMQKISLEVYNPDHTKKWNPYN